MFKIRVWYACVVVVQCGARVLRVNIVCVRCRVLVYIICACCVRACACFGSLPAAAARSPVRRLMAPFRHVPSGLAQALADDVEQVGVRGPAADQRPVHQHPRRAELGRPEFDRRHGVRDINLLGLRALGAGLDAPVVDAGALRAFLGRSEVAAVRALKAPQKGPGVLHRVGDGKGAPFEGVLLALAGAVLAEHGALRRVEALGRGRRDVALLDPAKHVIFGVPVGAAALRRVEVGVAPGHELEVDGVEHALRGEGRVEDAADEILALGSAGLAVEGERRRGGGERQEGEEEEEERRG